MMHRSLWLLPVFMVACSKAAPTSSESSNVASVSVSGDARVKVGLPDQYVAVVHLKDGTIGSDAVTWTVPELGTGTFPNGVITPSKAGSLTIKATAGGVSGTLAATAYDWTPFSSGTVVGTSLDAAVLGTSRLGVAKYANLLIGCVSGSLSVSVNFDNITTQSGQVNYSFSDNGNGTPVFATWLVSSDGHGLILPGTNAVLKTFLNQMAAKTWFSMGFSEYQGTSQGTVFITTGMTAALAPILAACPGSAITQGMEAETTATPSDLRDALLARSWPAVVRP